MSDKLIAAILENGRKPKRRGRAGYNAYRRKRGLDPISAEKWQEYNQAKLDEYNDPGSSAFMSPAERKAMAKTYNHKTSDKPFVSDGKGLTPLRTCAGYCDCPRCPDICPHYCIGGRNCCGGEYCTGA